MLQRFIGLCFFLLFTGCGEVKVSVIHEPPSVIINEPSEGSIFLAGESVLFSATALSSSDDPADLVHVWVSSNEEACPVSPVPADGKPTCIIQFLQPGSHTVTVTVTDSQSDSATASVGITIVENFPPSITIISPVDQDVFTPDELIVIKAEVGDVEDLAHELVLTVVSSIDDLLPLSASPGTDGLVNDSTYLTAGTHLLTYTVEDTLGNTASEAISVTVNSPPSKPEVELTPVDAGTGDALLATVTTESVDPEGDTITYYYDWKRNGADFANPTNPTLNNVIAEGVSAAGDYWEVFVYADDGYSSSELGFDFVNVGNEAPELTGCIISPSTPESSEDLLAIPLGWDDPDGDPEMYDYAWELYDGGSSGWIPVGGNDSTLTASFTTISDEIRVKCTPFNLVNSSGGSTFKDAGSTITSLTVTIGNSVPSITACEITPTSPTAADDLMATAAGIFDHDGDTISIAYVWDINGVTVIGATSDTLTAGGHERGDTVTVSCTPSDSIGAGLTETDDVIIVNGAPSAPVVMLDPSNAVTHDGLTVILDTPSADPDGDSIVYNYEWRKDGVSFVPSGAADEVASGIIFRGEEWTVVVSASDGSATGPDSSDQLTVENAPPVVGSCDVSPAVPSVDDDLVVTASGTTDAESDTVTVSYSWQIDFGDGNGFTDVGITGDTLNNALTEQGYGIKAICIPNDSFDDGEEVESPIVSLGNSAPSITSCDVTPGTPKSSDDLTASYSGYYDPNGDPETVYYSWWLNGVEDTSVTTDVYPSANTTRGDIVVATCQPYDGDLYGGSVDSADIEILNSAPDAPSVHIDPPGATSSDDLYAIIDVASIDPEGDAVSYQYDWTIGATSVGSTSVLPYTDTARDDVVVLTVVGCDNYGDCTAIGGYDNITIENSPPELASCTIDPIYPYAGQDLTATPSGEYDEDGDSVTFTYQWFVNSGGGFVDSGIYTQTLSGVSVIEGDEWQVECTPSDSTDDGLPTVSQSVLVGNAPPTVSSCTINPTGPNTSDTLTAVPSGSADPDGDPVTFVFRWLRNGIEDSTQVGSTYPSTSTLKGDIVEAECIPFDSFSYGIPAQTGQTTIENSAPIAPTITVNPVGATTLDNLTATLATAAVDPDGDSIVYSYAWNLNGQASSVNGSVVPYASTVRGDLWEVEVTACDQDPINPLCGLPGLANISVGNALPSITACSITPFLPDTGTDLSVTAANWSDPDGDTEQILYEWFIDTGAGFSSAGVSTSSLTHALTVKDYLVKVECTPIDAFGSGPVVTSSTVVIQNSAPSLSACEMFTTSPASDEDLAIVSGILADPDPGDSPTLRYEWYLNGLIDSAQTSASYPSSSTVRGDQIFARCYPTDGTTEGSFIETSVASVANSAPTAPVILLSPSAPFTTDQLNVSITTASIDADGDGITYTYTWTENSVLTGLTSSSVSSSSTSKGEVWEVSVLACDDYSIDPKCASQTVLSNVTILNSAPILQNVTLSPTTPSSLDDVVASAGTVNDADNDAVDFSIKWLHDAQDGNGFVEDTAELTNVFPYLKTSKGHFLKVEFTPIDSPDGLAGAAVQSGVVEVLNSAPTEPSVSVSPNSPGTNDDLSCLFSGSSDADTDPVTYHIEWYEASNGISSTNAAILPSSETSIGDRWHCEVTPNDGTVDGPTGTASFVDITDNTAPDAPIIDPIDSYRNDTDFDVTGSCEADCSLTFYCAEQFGTSWTESNTCSSSGSFTHAFANALSPGDPASCYATCKDNAQNESGASNQITTEACLVTDPYENSMGDGDSGGFAIDNWATMPDNNTVTAAIIGNILEESSVWDSDWFRFDTSDDAAADSVNGSNNFNFEVTLTQGAGTYSVVVYRGGYSSTQLQCAGLQNSGYTEYNYFSQDVGDGTHTAPAVTNECGPIGDPVHNVCEDLSDVFYVEVLRDPTAAASCLPYEIVVTNGAP